MTEPAPTDREAVAAELRRIRESVRDRALLPEEAGSARASDALRVRTPEAMPAMTEPPAAAPPARPDNTELNQLWDVAAPPARGLLGRWAERLLRAFRERQRAFNARQVQFDNELLAYLEARLDHTHRQYDAVLGVHRRHMSEIDERHLILQEELVAHVHDLVRRIDLVLGEAEKGRLGLESALRDVRARLTQMEARLDRG